MTEWDFIGDIHGNAKKLRLLLKKLGYLLDGACDYYHPDGRKVFFLGDYIDRGEHILETLRIVKTMCDNGHAVGIMGNHEFNLLCYLTRRTPEKNSPANTLANTPANTPANSLTANPPVYSPFYSPVYCRRHNKTHSQENLLTRKTLKKDKSTQNYLNWFLTLPIFVETKDFRVVHACWSEEAIKYFPKKIPAANQKPQPLLKSFSPSVGYIDQDMIATMHQAGSVKKKWAMEILLKGAEVELPSELHFFDNDDNLRKKSRLRWWVNLKNKSSVKELDFLIFDCQRNSDRKPLSQNQREILKKKIMKKKIEYSEKEKPVFFGHYWMRGEPKLMSKNICCLDYSVAKNGKLTAYRFDGEKHLNQKKLFWV